MTRYAKQWRLVIAFFMVFHFILVAPAQATVILPKTLHMRADRPMKFIAEWGVKEIGRFQVARYGWGKKQFACLNRLWTAESHWNFRASNTFSGAYGIPQALPGNKMEITGADWRTSPTTQIRWGIRYIKIRYGSPCQAWHHELSTGYY